jgi:lipopolysaccharide export system protein LptC
MARLILVLLFIAVMSFLWWPHFDEQAKPEPAAVDTAEPDYIAQGLKRTIFDDNGFVQTTVSAKKMRYFSIDALAEFEQPDVTLFTDQSAPSWNLTAQQGFLYANDKIVLENQVNATNLNKEEVIRTFQTAHLDVFIPERRMQANQEVTILGDNLIMSGKGMSAELDKKHVELTDHAKTTYKGQNEQ